jgi:hypothetical protein
VRLSIVWIEFDRSLELLLRALPVILEVSFFRSQRLVGFGKIVV